MEILTEEWEITGPNRLLFLAGDAWKKMSDMTFTVMLRRPEIPAVPLGFRSSFTDRTEELMEMYRFLLEFRGYVRQISGPSQRRTFQRGVGRLVSNAFSERFSLTFLHQFRPLVYTK
jgi:hypothetical protein